MKYGHWERYYNQNNNSYINQINVYSKLLNRIYAIKIFINYKHLQIMTSYNICSGITLQYKITYKLNTKIRFQDVTTEIKMSYLLPNLLRIMELIFYSLFTCLY